MWRPGTEKPLTRPTERSDGAQSTLSKSTENVNHKMLSKKNFSQKTLAMKFMQRKSADLRKGKKRDVQDPWHVDAPSLKKNDSSFLCDIDVPDPSLPKIFGRRSFGGFNKYIEDEYRISLKRIKCQYTEDIVPQGDEISSTEMTSRMIKYTGLRKKQSHAPKRQKKLWR
uniref:Uncharacterized protein AlNc14C158G7695 n=1 Tax=Albugo laibachii Nc14 TaxID=890382 RepID=F0WMK5_9STRA|nr:conserved hypothetical protein [Albugo laibachii Nc14]|eukprot:CCA22537.1 conserved hypothetical protein [Albugo laibachii Nc14]